jgi:DNA repair photolyase
LHPRLSISYCFARSTHRYLDLNPGRDFEREIIVKVNLPEVLRAELARPSWKRELVAIGTNTDPYQWVESRYRMMPEVLEALHAAQTPVSVLTKSPLVLRDIDLYVEMAEAAGATVNLSVPTLDEKVWRQTEPHTPHPRARLEAVAELNRRGISSGVLVMPLMPGINDSPEQVDPLVELAREAGASFVASTGLHLRGEVRDVFFGWLAETRPDLLERYEELYPGRRAYLPAKERQRLGKLVKGWGRNLRRQNRSAAGPVTGDALPGRVPRSARSGNRGPGTTRGRADSEPIQTSLF